MEVIFRNDIVEQARAGDKLVFSGSLVVVPDVSVITAPGQRSLIKGAGELLGTLLSCSKTASPFKRPASAACSRARVQLLVILVPCSRPEAVRDASNAQSAQPDEGHR